MKYIRTKDKMFEECDFSDLYINEVIKEADTIPELCDEFVYENEKGNKIVDKILTFAGFMNATGDYEFKYGAIWTEKGLIYVAKMNESGELELL